MLFAERVVPGRFDEKNKKMLIRCWNNFSLQAYAHPPTSTGVGPSEAQGDGRPPRAEIDGRQVVTHGALSISDRVAVALPQLAALPEP